MTRTERPCAYSYRGHRIEPLSLRIAGSEGWLRWLVCPDNGAESWYARSLAEAREAINATALEAG